MNRHYSDEEKKTIKQLAGKKTATEIAKILGRSRAGVSDFASRNNISLMQVGQYHYNAKINDLQVTMIWALYDAGFSVAEIHQNCFKEVSNTTIDDIVNFRTRRHG